MALTRISMAVIPTYLFQPTGIYLSKLSHQTSFFELLFPQRNLKKKIYQQESEEAFSLTKNFVETKERKN